LLASTINPPYLTLPTTNLNIYYLKTSFIYDIESWWIMRIVYDNVIYELEDNNYET
jgi:hypothetical protein